MKKIILPKHFKTSINYDYPLGLKTWYKIGGRADIFIEPKSLLELEYLIPKLCSIDTKLLFFGKGANILIDDCGIDKPVISLSENPFCSWRINESKNNIEIIANAGCDLFQIVKKTVYLGLNGLVHLTGIPGTIGGAIAMNAGGKWGDTFDTLKHLKVMSNNGKILKINKDEIEYGYRKGINNGLIIEATFATEKYKNTDNVIKKWRSIFTEKKKSQPLSESSPGCTFKNPLDTNQIRISAGKLIDSCKLKNFKYGKATVSSTHANFLIAEKETPTSDILKLMDIIKKKVYEMHAISLEKEVVIWCRQ